MIHLLVIGPHSKTSSSLKIFCVGGQSALSGEIQNEEITRHVRLEYKGDTKIKILAGLDCKYSYSAIITLCQADLSPESTLHSAQ